MDYYCAKFCSKCKMIMSFEDYQEALESQSRKEDELKSNERTIQCNAISDTGVDNSHW